MPLVEFRDFKIDEQTHFRFVVTKASFKKKVALQCHFLPNNAFAYGFMLSICFNNQLVTGDITSISNRMFGLLPPNGSCSNYRLNILQLDGHDSCYWFRKIYDDICAQKTKVIIPYITVIPCYQYLDYLGPRHPDFWFGHRGGKQGIIPIKDDNGALAGWNPWPDVGKPGVFGSIVDSMRFLGEKTHWILFFGWKYIDWFTNILVVKLELVEISVDPQCRILFVLRMSLKRTSARFFFLFCVRWYEESPMDVYGSLDFFSDTVYQMDIRLMADMRTIYVISNHRFIEYKKTPQASAKVSIWISHVRRLKIHKRAAIPLEIDPRFLFRDLVCYELHSKSIQTNPVNQQKSCPTTL